LHSTSKAKIRLRICNPHLVGILVVQQAHHLCASRATEYILGICNSDPAIVIWPQRR
jgi:hypothetical protein